MELALHYGNLSDLISKSNKLADKLDVYCDDLSRKVQSKLDSVEGGMNGRLNSADYYVDAKLRQVREKRDNAKNIALKTQTLLDTAKRVDQDVEGTIRARQKELFQKNPELKPPKYKAAVTKLICGCEDVPVLGWIIKGGEAIADGVTSLKSSLKYWYKCEGGKELVGVVLSVVGAVLAVVVLVCACAFTGGTLLAVLTGVAGLVTAAIGAVNAVTNIVTSFAAYDAAMGGHPGMAKIYSEQDTMADFLRETNFHDKDMNRASYIGATAIEITDALFSILSIVCGGVKLVKDLKSINIQQTLKSVCTPRSSLGTFLPEEPNIMTGLKSLASRFNFKDLLLGDLNVKDLTRLKRLDNISRLKAIGSFSKACLGIVKDLDKMNEGKMNIGELLAKRLRIGVEKNIFDQEKLQTVLKTSHGEKIAVRKFEDTNLSTILKVLPTAIDSVGLGKLMNDWIGNDTLDNIFDFEDGIAGEVKSMIDSITMKDQVGYVKPIDFKAPVLNLPSFDVKGFVFGKTESFSSISMGMPYVFAGA